MSQLFNPSVNTFARISVLAGGLATAFVLAIVFGWQWSPYTASTGPSGVAIEQPVRFSHQLHSNQLNIECRYCHENAEYSAYGGIPSTHTCMSCHSQIATYSELLEPVRTSYETGEPVVWNRVHDLAEHVYFNHSAHVTNGFACETCHGRVDQMPLVWQVESLSMSWCLECHWAPEEYIRPVEHVYTFGYEYPENQTEVGLQLIEEYGIHNLDRLDNCNICHY
jgi:hypothetical protein